MSPEDEYRLKRQQESNKFWIIIFTLGYVSTMVSSICQLIASNRRNKK